jgi:hypothetical protein
VTAAIFSFYRLSVVVPFKGNFALLTMHDTGGDGIVNPGVPDFVPLDCVSVVAKGMGER